MSYLNSEEKLAAHFIPLYSDRYNMDTLLPILATSRRRQLERLHCSPLRFQQQAILRLSQEFMYFQAQRLGLAGALWGTM